MLLQKNLRLRSLSSFFFHLSLIVTNDTGNLSEILKVRVKISDTMVARRRNLAKTPLKHSPKKRNLDQNINDSKSRISNSFFENMISGIQLFYIRPHISVDIIRVFFNFRFSSRKSQSQQKLAKINSLEIENNMLRQHSQKPFSL